MRGPWSGLKPRRGSMDRNLGMGWIVRHIVMRHGDGSALSEVCRYRRATLNRTNLSFDAWIPSKLTGSCLQSHGIEVATAVIKMFPPYPATFEMCRQSKVTVKPSKPKLHNHKVADGYRPLNG